ncbi:hypothetical protein, variant [Phytophthora nicotianae CJ01A1]|uniref:Uncharacterized protein n=5 Tax=Phytophthora nicotianae TaxID=4792 RepID=W2PSE5_PHYN3|nr:hypothetical protein, variant [Phytophthora nicotianae INRA-310]ETI37753.1 hypothetical protein, variant [Phytophthora nicotianae P1569]ETK77974.1 hypothetical protein, variant [Phytophthora nicotianae]ETP07513.1 hypothetical protein, variant [Phytophthora nicotianae CJ01A1]ETP35687.1 hypothetical protein, variant [Phytophthora nicotianae P10297]ETL31407.1 hypothetical protein, variant [Phytophthora nicotianae]
MAKIEEIAELSGIERWKAQRLARKLDGDIQQLKVALSELDTVKPKKTTYTKKANVFFLEKRNVIVKNKKSELKGKEKKRHDVGLKLRNSSQ